MSGGLRFAMLTTFYPPWSFGGDAVYVQRLSRSLVRQGHHVSVIHDVDAWTVLRNDASSPAAPAVDDGVEVHSLRSGVPGLSALAVHQVGRPLLKGRRIRDILRRGRFDVVNFHNVSLLGGPGLFHEGGDAVRLYMAHEHWLVCPPSVLWRHRRELCDKRECVRCALHHRRPPQLWRYSGLMERELAHVDAFIALSEFSRQKHREFGFPRDMEVLPPMLPDSPPLPEVAGSAASARAYFLFVGRLERIKGLDEVIDVMPRLPGIDLLVAGDGDDGDALRARAAGMPNVRFLGTLPPDHLTGLYRNAIAAVVPSRCFETFGMVIIEAFRQAVPVIARRLGPFPEIVQASAGGELFTTTGELEAAMRRLADDRPHRNRLALAGRAAYLEYWTEGAVLPRYLDIVRRAAERRGVQRVADVLATECAPS